MSKKYCLLWEKETWYLFDVSWEIKNLGYPAHTYVLYSAHSNKERDSYDVLKEYQAFLQLQKTIPTPKNKKEVFPKLEDLLKKSKINKK